MQSSVSGLNVEVTNDTPPVVKLRGEADFHNKHQICEVFGKLVEDGQAIIHADLSELAYVDSSGLAALVGCAAKASKAGGAIELLGVSDRVSRVLTLCGAAAFFDARGSDVPVCRDGEATAPSEGFWHVSDFSLPASPGAAAIARNRVADVVRSLPLSLTEGQDVLTAVGEALANAIKHGCGCSPEMKISVKCVAGAGRLAVDIIDPGPGFDPEAVGQHTPHSLAEGGMGIYMMRELMDEVSFAFDNCTTVRLVKHLRNLTPQEPTSVGEAAGVQRRQPQEAVRDNLL